MSTPQTTVRPSGVAASRGAVMAVMVLFAAYSVLPVWWLVVTATKNKGYLFTTNGFWFSHFDLWSNIRDVFAMDDGIFARWMLNSVVYSAVGAAISTLVCAAAGFALAKYQFRGREAVFNTVLAAVLVPGALFALPLYLMFSKIHLVNTYWAVLIPSVVSPFGVYLTRVYATASVPDELLEAGRVDGASEARIFFTIVLRMMSPALVTVYLFQFVGIWNNYLLPVLMLADDRLQPVTVGLATWREQFNNGTPYNVTITGAFLSVLPLVVAFLSLQRFWRSGLAAGGLK
ncbi:MULTISPECIES: carbohydrate ABC transporter permease [unclassified Streptomyces]|uniref:carbohydrate ABC transporter permease n=1 Tax=unclassified Streptomyces TaxID=2593676 RepID=UPI002DDC4E2A|nr:carbohydrate ABC transporter permease [Streptomyces sp. NBC_01445]WSE11293.1 carbohydrate ABC transporter permease [Streptomyces sp. NBC_01445]